MKPNSGQTTWKGHVLTDALLGKHPSLLTRGLRMGGAPPLWVHLYWDGQLRRVERVKAKGTVGTWSLASDVAATLGTGCP